ncbi:MAG: CBS and ACT domain-containing protein [Eubacteriaceae bacterium]|nr:CBS and ACT domain-containing protein [Eubacteriaceae bacterium]
MLVKERMSSNLQTLRESVQVSEAMVIFKEKGLKRMPVVDAAGYLVGIITSEDILKVSPTQATSLSIHEINYILSKTFVYDVMQKQVVTISPEELIEEAAVMLRVNKIGAVVVVEGKKPVGILTESDIFDAFIDVLGFKSLGSRISIIVKDVPGVIADIGEVFKKRNMNITNIANFANGTYAEVLVRTDSYEIQGVMDDLESLGYEIDSLHQYY